MPCNLFLVTAGPSFTSPESIFGHTFLVFSANSSPQLGDLAVTVVADTRDHEKGLVYLLKGISNGFSSKIVTAPYFQIIRTYTYEQNRTLYYKRLETNEVQVQELYHNILTGIFELPPYNFVFHNCAHGVGDLLKYNIDHGLSLVSIESPIGLLKKAKTSSELYKVPSIYERVSSEFSGQPSSEEVRYYQFVTRQGSQFTSPITLKDSIFRNELKKSDSEPSLSEIAFEYNSFRSRVGIGIKPIEVDVLDFAEQSESVSLVSLLELYYSEDISRNRSFKLVLFDIYNYKNVNLNKDSFSWSSKLEFSSSKTNGYFGLGSSVIALDHAMVVPELVYNISAGAELRLNYLNYFHGSHLLHIKFSYQIADSKVEPNFIFLKRLSPQYEASAEISRNEIHIGISRLL